MKRGAVLALLPVLAAQGLWVRARVPRLAEADGPRKGRLGSGAPLRVLILGDSSAAGVGVAMQDEALSGQLAARLGSTREVMWELHARSGATTAQVLAEVQEAALGRFDVAVVGLGVNDCKNGVPLARWVAQSCTLYDLLRTKCGVRLICASALPPMGDLPALPRPLSTVMAARAAVFDAALVDMTKQMPDLRRVRPDIAINAQVMAADGFHPGPLVYAAWAEAVAAEVAALS
ncbi:SGNH/GDSL hydrolase family protein [Pseudosulfitobacter pseudonitzschiae]|uniref:SGNH/GDSL hydrolase family protein n=1 Tax=Pseudosulfitobacter pseudonitzschiae TaxID=1402135 RepID=UPI001AF7EDBC|nr:SGNH/GDSL hydrolase family protein [Pseudosulfitobacter pseudonitzschiae]MBM1815368.1 SGNH/GDSL hydrolase family protein [Pseudosulfitobacter pseudonitzschiae]MBM1832359.1 SGNH/GDSL hydrolase family protein [Pseudosulfitobacter pseudonitzschiae]MBM1837227.1 SGNH/GDSL hydrolase family protein [Pseudosulfitobacter pseudonitzschiae]MBM1842073.1 SGNH/GDSL hydrolase family protein [Pseudosulfitobacter pseudonitzschiae]MBM1846941.1 SGNH/GDSL hydrolase family protein [Pseudosulfitobacter pseudonit